MNSGVKYLKILENKYVYDGEDNLGNPLYCERSNIIVLLNELRGKNAVWEITNSSKAAQNHLPVDIHKAVWEIPIGKQTSLFDFEG